MQEMELIKEEVKHLDEDLPVILRFHPTVKRALDLQERSMVLFDGFLEIFNFILIDKDRAVRNVQEGIGNGETN